MTFKCLMLRSCDSRKVFKIDYCDRMPMIIGIILNLQKVASVAAVQESREEGLHIISVSMHASILYIYFPLIH